MCILVEFVRGVCGGERGGGERGGGVCVEGSVWRGEGWEACVLCLWPEDPDKTAGL